MEKKKLKRIMTDFAAGHITQKEVDNLIKPKKTQPDKPKQGKRASQSKDLKINEKGGKTKSHKIL